MKITCMKRLSIFSLTLLVAFTADKPAYQLFRQGGAVVSYAEMIKALGQADVVLFGELHNNPICHWLEVQVMEDLYQIKKDKLVLGAEMFEADNQLILNEYLQGKITEGHLQTEAKVWDNYATDYKPLVDFAKARRIPFIATNIPRRYASLVSKSDLAALDSLATEAKQWIAPLPIPVDLSLPGYQQMLTMAGNGMGHGSGMNPERMAKAQAVKDATMAHFILENRRDGQTLLHFNGAYHSDNFEGIAWYLKKQDPKLKILTITSVEQENVAKLEPDNAKTASFIITIPADMTKTY